MNPRRARLEAGMSISMAVLALTIVAMIMLFVGTQTMNSIVNTKTKQERSVGMAAGDSGIEKIRAALQGRLMDETDGWQLSEADLKALVEEQPNATVLPNSQTSDAAGMVPVRVSAASRFSVREAGTNTVGFWQVYDVIAPRYLDRPAMNLPATNLVVYIRAWATSTTSNTITTAPRIFRIEYRPSYISDYQSVTDAPFFVKDNAGFTIDGPIHSNGYTTVDWLAMANGTTRKGIYFQHAPTCTNKAAFTTSQNAAISIPTGNGSCNTARANAKRHARQISLLGVQDTYEHIDSRCGAPMVRCYTTGGPYTISLGNQGVRINGANVPLQTSFDAGSLAILLDGDVRISGALQMPANLAGRVTIATRRRSTADRQPQVVLAATGGIVGAATPLKDSIGIVTQGDVVLENNAAACNTAFNVAVISQSGSVTIPPEFVTLAPPAIELGGRECGNPTSFYGSFSAHGQFVSSIKWPDVRTGGMTPTIGYSKPVMRYNRNLFLNPPPFFPIALPWALTKVKDADRKCLVPPLAGDPRCE